MKMVAKDKKEAAALAEIQIRLAANIQAIRKRRDLARIFHRAAVFVHSA
jgi:hypothetical protein